MMVYALIPFGSKSSRFLKADVPCFEAVNPSNHERNYSSLNLMVKMAIVKKYTRLPKQKNDETCYNFVTLKGAYYGFTSRV